MAEKHFEVVLLEEVLAGFGWQEAEVPAKVREALIMELLRRDQLSEAQVPAKVREALIMELLRRDQLSEAQAAELLYLDRWELLALMGRYQVPAISDAPRGIAA